MNVQIYNMNLNDLNSISDILSSDFDDFWNVNILEQELKNENSKYIVAKLNNEIIGFAGIKIVFNEADIMNIVVKKNFRNQKIGTLLLEKILELCIDLKIKTITLEVNETNTYAISLYKKHKFNKISKRKNYYESQTAIIMQRLL